MKLFAMSDIHGFLQEFEAALELVDLSGENKLILLGDYVHGGLESYDVLDKVMALQRKYGPEKVVALMGNHEEMVLEERFPIQEDWNDLCYGEDVDDEKYRMFLQSLPLYHVEEDIIFVHAGVDEMAGEEWEWESTDRDYLEKFPAEIGHFEGGMTIVAGHVGISVIAGDPRFQDIFHDGESHYYIDGTVHVSGAIPVLMYDEDSGKFYQMAEWGRFEIEAYEG